MIKNLFFIIHISIDFNNFPVNRSIVIEDDANKMNKIIINKSYKMIFRYDNEDKLEDLTKQMEKSNLCRR